MKDRFRALAEAAALATGTTVEVAFTGGAMSMHRNRTLEAALGRERRGLRHRRRGPRPELGQHRHGQRELGLPDDPPGARRSPTRARPAHSILFRDAAATPAGRRDDAPRRDARRPDGVRAVRRPAARRRRVAGVPRRGLIGRAVASQQGPAGARMRTGAPRWTLDANRRRPQRDDVRSRGPTAPIRPSPEDFVAERPHDPDASRPHRRLRGRQRLGPRVRDLQRLRAADVRRPDDVHEPAVDHGPAASSIARGVDVAIIGAPFDDAVSHRPGARFGPRAIREAQYTSGSINSLQLGIEPFELLTVVDAGDANIVPAWIERGHALIYRKVLEVARTGAIPIVLGGDHSITWPSATAVAEVRRPGQRRDRPLRRPCRHRERRLGRARRPRHADAAADRIGRGPRQELRPGRAARLLAAGRVFEWMQEHGLRYHFMTEIEERGADAVIDDAIAEALDGADSIYLSVDIDVVDPGLAPGHRHARAGRPDDPRAPPGDPPDRRPRSTWPGWTSSRSRRRTTTPRQTSMIAQPGGARGDQRPRRQAARRRRPSASSRRLGRHAADDGATPRRGDALARLYDLDLVEDPGDLDLYLALAARTGGPILELAAGTGRLAVPLGGGRPRRHRRRHRSGDARAGPATGRRRRAARRRADRARRGRPARPGAARAPARSGWRSSP